MKYHYSNLEVFGFADNLVKQLYKTLLMFPNYEKYAITDQLRRASLSVVLNIVEGQTRKIISNKDCLRFFKISLGSLYETEYLLNLSHDFNYINTNNLNQLQRIRGDCCKKLWRLIQSMENTT